MTIPFTPPQIDQPQVLGGGLEEQFLKFLLQGAQFSQQAQGLSLDKERLKLEKQRQKHTEGQDAAEATRREAVGQILQQILGLQAPAAPTTAPAPELDPSDPTGMAELPLPVAAPQPTMSDIFQRAPAAALPEVVRLAGTARELTQDAERLQRMNDVLSRQPDPQVRKQFSDFFQMQQSGATVPSQMQAVLFPVLFPAGIEPERMNSIWNFMKTTGGTFGQGRRALGVNPVEGISDDMVSPLRQTRPTQQEQYAAGLLGAVEREVPIILGTVEAAGGGIDLPTSLLAQFRRNIPIAEVVNELPDAAQRQFLNANLRAANAIRFAISGKQTTNIEFIEFLTTRLPFRSDDVVTRQQKLAALQGDVDVIREMTGGTGKPSIVLERMLRLARLQGWRPEVIRAYEAQLTDAKAWERNAARRRALFVDDAPTDASSFDANYDMWRGLIEGRKP